MYIDAKQVIERYGISKATLYNWLKQGIFPQGIYLGNRIRRWEMSEIEAYERQRKNAGHEDSFSLE